jgi:hypothetical protein
MERAAERYRRLMKCPVLGPGVTAALSHDCEHGILSLDRTKADLLPMQQEVVQTGAKSALGRIV